MTHNTNPMLILGIAAAFGVAAFVHLLRRYPSMRVRTSDSRRVSFDRVQRILHWCIGIDVAGLVVTGLPVYLAQFLVSPSVPTPLRFFYWGLQVAAWRTIHIYVGLLLVALIAVHALWDVYNLRHNTAILRVTNKDYYEMAARARSFLGMDSEYHSSPSKYDGFRKLFHWSLLVLGAFLLVSGLLEWEAITWQGIPLFVWLDRWNHFFMDDFIRTGHLVVGMLVFGLVIVHAYFALLPQNRSLLRAISTGAASSARPSSSRGYDETARA